MAENLTPCYSLKNMSLHFGLNPLFDDITLHIKKGDKICLIGRNGSGKSTLLKVISGLMDIDSGEIYSEPGLKITYMDQESDLSGFTTLKDYILSGSNPDSHEEYKADILIEELDILAHQEVQTASGGEKKKAALAHALIQEPDVLLLDEPTNHLDITTIEKLEEIIKNFSGAVIVISHDRRFLTNISTNTFWLDRGKIHINDKGYAFFNEWQEEIINQEIIEQKNLNKRIQEETEWLHKGVTARRKRNMGRLRRLIALREERKNQIKQVGKVKMEADKGAIQSKLISELKHVSKSFGEREIVKDFSTRILRGNKIGIVGPNGAGKSTLIKLITKRLEPDNGFVRIAKNLEEGYFDQNRIDLDPKKTLWKTLCPEGDHIFVRGSYRHVVSYLKDFLFTSGQANSPVGILSGGEKNRLMLALILSKPSNFLVLDEPTNDLDIDTLDLLQEVLDEYDGTVLIVSHDRDFLDKVAVSLLYMQGNGDVIEHIGTYSELINSLSKNKKEKPQVKEKAKEKTSQKTVNEKQKKLSFTQKHQLEKLPSEIEALTQKASLLEEKLNDPTLWEKSPAEFTQISTKLANLKTQIEEKENLWLELEILASES